MFKVGDEVVVKPSAKFMIYEYDQLGVDDVLCVRKINFYDEFPYECVDEEGREFSFLEKEIIHSKPISLEDLM